MNRPSLVEKLLQRRQQCCRAFSSSSAHEAPSQQNNLAQLEILAAMSRGRDSAGRQRTTRSKQSPQQIREGKFALARETLRMGEPQSSSRNPSVTVHDRAVSALRVDDLSRQLRRRWKPGDVYAPHDLSFQEQEKYRPDPRKPPEYDAFDLLGLDPVKEYKNFALMSEFMSDTGRILHHSRTGLRPKNQRKIAKAIRRAIGLGIMPSVHKHPEILERTMYKRGILL